MPGKLATVSRSLPMSVSQLINSESRRLNPLHYPAESMALWHINQLWLEICESGDALVGKLETMLSDGFESVSSFTHGVELPVPNSPNPSFSSSNSGGRDQHGSCRRNSEQLVTSHRRAGPGVAVHEMFKCLMSNVKNRSSTSSMLGGGLPQRSVPAGRRITDRERDQATLYTAAFLDMLRGLMGSVEDFNIDDIAALEQQIQQDYFNHHELSAGSYGG